MHSSAIYLIEQLHKRRGLKWHEHEPHVIPAWVAEMDFPVAPPVRRALRRVVDYDELGYPPRGAEGPVTRLQHVFATRMASRFGWHAAPDEVRLVADLEQAMIASILAFSDPENAVVLQPPVYPPFRQCIENAGRQPLDNPLKLVNGRFEIDFAGLDASMSRAKILLFCNPQNPTGRVFTANELRQVIELANAHDLIIVSDEIHADIVFENHRHIPIASISDAAAARTITITSATKAFNIPGLRCGLMHFGSSGLHERFRKAIPDQLLGHSNIAGMRATLAAWEEGATWLEEALQTLTVNRGHLRKALASDLRPLSGTVPEGTFMSWIDVRSLPFGDVPAGRWLLERTGVAMTDGASFGPDGNGHVRLNFATSGAIFDEILQRLRQGLSGLS